MDQMQLNFKPIYSSFYLPHAGNVILYKNGDTLCCIDWETKALFHCVCDHPDAAECEKVAAAYLDLARGEPIDTRIYL